MATLRTRYDKDGRKRYQMIVEIYRKGKRFFKSKTFDSARKAWDWEKKFTYEVDTGIVTKEALKKRKLSDAIEKYTSTVLVHKPKNARNVQQHLKWWNEEIGNLDINEVERSVLAECRDKLLTQPNKNGKIRSSNTCLKYIVSLSTVLEYAVKEWAWLTVNPMRSIKKPRIGKGRIRFFNIDEIQKIQNLCSASENPYLETIFIVALHTGMRKGEILTLTWENIDFKRKEIQLQTSKNGEPRDIPMSEAVFQALSKLSSSKLANISGLLFPSPNNSKKPIDIRSAWERVLQKAGIQDGTFHSIRHTTCTMLAQIGLSPILTARFVGHRDSKMTDRYTHSIKSHIIEAVGKMEVLIKNK